MSKSKKVPASELDLNDYAAELGDDLGRELELYFPAIVDILLPEMFKSINDLPKTLQPFVRKLRRHKDLLSGEIETDPENILAKRELVKIVLDHLEPENNRIHGPTKEITTAMLETRQAIADIKHDPDQPLQRWWIIKRRLDALRTEYEQQPGKKPAKSLVLTSIRNETVAIIKNILAQEIGEKEPLDQNKIRFCIAHLQATMKKIKRRIRRKYKDVPISNGKPSHDNYVPFFDLPPHIQTMLIFDPIEAIAEREGILPQEAMESPMNRIAMVNALRILLGLNVTNRNSFYRRVITEQRKDAAENETDYVSTWRKCLSAQIKKTTADKLAIYRYFLTDQIYGRKS